MFKDLSPEEKMEWMQLVYEEAWRQYVHEDEIAEQRDTKYLTILSLVFTALGVVVSMVLSHLVELETVTIGNAIYAIIIGIIILAMLMLILCFTRHWKQVTLAGRKYVQIRLDVAKEIENGYALSVNLAASEQARLEMPQRKSDMISEGFDSTLSIMRIINTAAWSLLALDMIGIIIGIVYCLM